MFFNKKKIKYLDLIIALVISFVCIELILNYKAEFAVIGSILNILKPFILAFIIAYIFNPLINLLENKLKCNRSCSLFLTYIIIGSVITIFLMVLLPRIFNSGMEMVQIIPDFTERVYKGINESFSGKLINSTDFIKNNAGNFIQKFGDISSNWINIALSKTISITSSLINIIFGLIISIYILYDKEKYINISKNLIYITFKDKFGNNIIKFLKIVHKMIVTYLGIKAVDSIIIGFVCFIGLVFFKSPYILIISVIVAITNMIPYFGPFIGMIPPFVINLFYNPRKAVWILLFLILLQQFDAWFLEPKLVGNRVGLNPFLIILGITIGGSLFGVWGMILASPTMAVLKIYVGTWFDNKVEQYNRKKSKDC